MLRLACVLRRGPGGSMPSFPSDTLTKVYRDALKGGVSTKGSFTPLSSLGQWSNDVEVTSHVGGIGTMSPGAIASRVAETAAATASDAHHQGGGAKKHRQISRHGPRVKPPSSSDDIVASASDPTAAPSVVTSVEALHARKARSSAGPGRQASAGTRHSGVQKEILTLYRGLLRETNRMRDADTRCNLRRYIRGEFDKHVDVPRKHIAKIEWCINFGKRKLEEMQSMSVHTKFSVR